MQTNRPKKKLSATMKPYVRALQLTRSHLGYDLFGEKKSGNSTILIEDENKRFVFNFSMIGLLLVKM